MESDGARIPNRPAPVAPLSRVAAMPTHGKTAKITDSILTFMIFPSYNTYI
jgi:hypothetical protein